MSQLNNAVIKRIMSQLDSSVFSVGDFTVEFPDEGNLAVISFNPDGYFFSLREGVSGMIWTREQPGDYRCTQDYNVRDIDEAIRRIPQWCKNVQAELRTANPIYDELQKLRESLENQIRENIKDPEEYFSKQEAQALQAKLDEIALKFEELQQQKGITEAELNRIKNEISELKINVSTYKKGTFFRTAGNKFMSILKQTAMSKPVQELLVETTKRFLLPPS